MTESIQNINITELLQSIIVWVPGILLAITTHEWAHGYMAYRFGDDTPKKMGRLTLNPIPHIDPVWTLFIPGFMLITSLLTTGNPFVFGGAKPVPINPNNFRKSGKSFRMAMFWVSAAGPLINLLLALVCALMFRGILYLPHYFMAPLANMLIAAIQMNVLLAAFNLLPLPPLDGGRIAIALLPSPLDQKLASLERFGLPIILVLAFSGMLSMVLLPIISLLTHLFIGIAGLS